MPLSGHVTDGGATYFNHVCDMFTFQLLFISRLSALSLKVSHLTVIGMGMNEEPLSYLTQPRDLLLLLNHVT